MQGPKAKSPLNQIWNMFRSMLGPKGSKTETSPTMSKFWGMVGSQVHGGQVPWNFYASDSENEEENNDDENKSAEDDNHAEDDYGRKHYNMEGGPVRKGDTGGGYAEWGNKWADSDGGNHMGGGYGRVDQMEGGYGSGGTMRGDSERGGYMGGGYGRGSYVGGGSGYPSSGKREDEDGSYQNNGFTGGARREQQPMEWETGPRDDFMSQGPVRGSSQSRVDSTRGGSKVNWNGQMSGRAYKAGPWMGQGEDRYGQRKFWVWGHDKDNYKPRHQSYPGSDYGVMDHMRQGGFGSDWYGRRDYIDGRYIHRGYWDQMRYGGDFMGQRYGYGRQLDDWFKGGGPMGWRYEHNGYWNGRYDGGDRIGGRNGQGGNWDGWQNRGYPMGGNYGYGHPSSSERYSFDPWMDKPMDLEWEPWGSRSDWDGESDGLENQLIGEMIKTLPDEHKPFVKHLKGFISKVNKYVLLSHNQPMRFIC